MSSGPGTALEGEQPSRRDGISAEEEAILRAKSIYFLRELARTLRL